MPSRREVLLQLGALLLTPRALRAEEAYGLGDWTGESFAAMHAIRDGDWTGRPLPPPERTVDVAVVGGGLAGLAVAELLAERDLVVLEREGTPGGNARAGSWRGIDYALGSAYFVDTTRPFGPFYERIGITPKAVPEPADTMLTGAPNSPDALAGPLRQPFARLRRHLAAVANSPDFPKTDLAAASPKALALDGLSFLDYLRRYHVDPHLLPLIDAYCYSSLGAGAGAVSAYAGVNFYSEIAGSIYALPGGNAAIAKALAARIEAAGSGRILTNTAVFAIEPAEDGLARVGWFDAANPGEPHAIAARWVVVAAPFFFAGRILRGVPQDVTAAMRATKRGSYLVANCCFEGSLGRLAYDSWTPGNPAFTDVVAAGGTEDHGVLTVYAPFRDPAEGRARLLEGDRQRLTGPIVDGLKRFLPDALSGARLVEVRPTRWGHQHLIPGPGTIRLMRGLPKRSGNVLLAHSDGGGMPAVESALTEAMRAVDSIRAG